MYSRQGTGSTKLHHQSKFCLLVLLQWLPSFAGWCPSSIPSFHFLASPPYFYLLTHPFFWSPFLPSILFPALLLLFLPSSFFLLWLSSALFSSHTPSGSPVPTPFPPHGQSCFPSLLCSIHLFFPCHLYEFPSLLSLISSMFVLSWLGLTSGPRVSALS